MTTLNYKQLKKEFIKKQRELDRDRTNKNIIKAIKLNKKRG